MLHRHGGELTQVGGCTAPVACAVRERSMADPARRCDPTDRYTSAKFARGSTNGCGPGVAGGRRRNRSRTPVMCSSTRSATPRSSWSATATVHPRAAELLSSSRHQGGVGAAAGLDCLRCPYHGWRYDLDGRLVEVVDRDDFGSVLPDDLALVPVAVGAFGDSCSSPRPGLRPARRFPRRSSISWRVSHGRDAARLARTTVCSPPTGRRS